MATHSLTLKMRCYFCAILYLQNFFLKRKKKEKKKKKNVQKNSRLINFQKRNSLHATACIIMLQITKTEQTKRQQHFLVTDAPQEMLSMKTTYPTANIFQ
jgi:uncharacterized membrane protein